MPAVELEGVGKRFGRHWALAHVTFSVDAGRTCLLTGANGAGKTTLLRVLATALAPSLGRFRLFGRDARADVEAIRPRLALLTHHSHLYGDLSGRENLHILTRLVGSPRVSVNSALERVGLEAAADRAVRNYSAGMKRRLGLARVLIARPELILLDEPFGQLDPAGVALMEDVIFELKEEGATLFVTTHDIARGKRVGDVHLEMLDGQPVSEPMFIERSA
ncbi:MAG: heme ABC exporter ATP-binding protein CcmA [Myxococcota bacterium]